MAPGSETPAALEPLDDAFDDLLAANGRYAQTYDLGGYDGYAHAGIAVVTCMDSRIEPLGMIGLRAGDAKIFRNPGGRVTDAALEALVLGVHLLGVRRILVIPHTKCAMVKNSQEQLRTAVAASSGIDSSWMSFHVVPDQRAALVEDVARVRTHPLIPDDIVVGGFVYDVETGLLGQVL